MAQRKQHRRSGIIYYTLSKEGYEQMTGQWRFQLDPGQDWYEKISAMNDALKQKYPDRNIMMSRLEKWDE